MTLSKRAHSGGKTTTSLAAGNKFVGIEYAQEQVTCSPIRELLCANSHKIFRISFKNHVACGYKSGKNTNAEACVSHHHGSNQACGTITLCLAG